MECLGQTRVHEVVVSAKPGLTPTEFAGMVMNKHQRESVAAIPMHAMTQELFATFNRRCWATSGSHNAACIDQSVT